VSGFRSVSYLIAESVSSRTDPIARDIALRRQGSPRRSPVPACGRALTRWPPRRFVWSLVGRPDPQCVRPEYAFSARGAVAKSSSELQASHDGHADHLPGQRVRPWTIPSRRVDVRRRAKTEVAVLAPRRVNLRCLHMFSIRRALRTRMSRGCAQKARLVHSSRRGIVVTAVAAVGVNSGSLVGARTPNP
jgi:hypothetical protein